MKKQKTLLYAGFVGIFSLSISSTSVYSETAEITKPKGAMGSGNIKDSQPRSNQFWWPDQLDLSSLRDHDSRSNPYGSEFDYAAAFAKLDLDAVKATSTCC